MPYTLPLLPCTYPKPSRPAGIDLELGTSRKWDSQTSGYLAAVVGVHGVLLKTRLSRAGQTFECPVMLSDRPDDWAVHVCGGEVSVSLYLCLSISLSLSLCLWCYTGAVRAKALPPPATANLLLPTQVIGLPPPPTLLLPAQVLVAVYTAPPPCPLLLPAHYCLSRSWWPPTPTPCYCLPATACPGPGGRLHRPPPPLHLHQPLCGAPAAGLEAACQGAGREAGAAVTGGSRTAVVLRSSGHRWVTHGCSTKEQRSQVGHTRL